MSKRILLTGATGYLGSHLAAALLDAGHSIVAFKRRTSSLLRIEPILTKITLLNVEEFYLHKQLKNYGKFDVVIHTATSYGRKNESFIQLADANLNFPLRLLDAAAAAEVPLFLNTDTSLGKFVNAYSLSKTQFAEWGRFFAEQKKIHFLNLKLEHFYGPDDEDTKFTTHVINSCMMNESELKLTLGEQKRDFIYIDDVVAAYLLLLEKQEALSDWYSDVGVGSGRAVTIRQFVELVKQITKSTTCLQFGALPCRAGEVMFSQADTSVLEKLGWRCRHTLEQGLKLAIKGNKQ